VQVASPAAAFTPPSADSPLPVRMRPAGLDELVGQEHLLAPGARCASWSPATSPMSVILWGPPGTGKTTIAHLVAPPPTASSSPCRRCRPASRTSAR
jgi:putative ATPase